MSVCRPMFAYNSGKNFTIESKFSGLLQGAQGIVLLGAKNFGVMGRGQKIDNFRFSLHGRRVVGGTGQP